MELQNGLQLMKLKQETGVEKTATAPRMKIVIKDYFISSTPTSFIIERSFNLGYSLHFKKMQSN